jgi:hypothetical protein
LRINFTQQLIFNQSIEDGKQEGLYEDSFSSDSYKYFYSFVIDLKKPEELKFVLVDRIAIGSSPGNSFA